MASNVLPFVSGNVLDQNAIAKQVHPNIMYCLAPSDFAINGYANAIIVLFIQLLQVASPVPFCLARIGNISD